MIIKAPQAHAYAGKTDTTPAPALIWENFSRRGKQITIYLYNFGYSMPVVGFGMEDAGEPCAGSII